MFDSNRVLESKSRNFWVSKVILIIRSGRVDPDPQDDACLQISMLSYFHGDDIEAWQDTGC